MNPYFNVPEIHPLELKDRLLSDRIMLLLDVRERWELRLAALQDERVALAPMSALSQAGLAALPLQASSREAEIVVICHHGHRSAEVTAWLLAQGWTNVRSLAGGLDAYASQVDPSVGFY